MVGNPFYPACDRCTSPRTSAVRIEAGRRVYLCADCVAPDRPTLDDICAVVMAGGLTGRSVVGLARAIRRGR